MISGHSEERQAMYRNSWDLIYNHVAYFKQHGCTLGAGCTYICQCQETNRSKLGWGGRDWGLASPWWGSWESIVGGWWDQRG